LQEQLNNTSTNGRTHWSLPEYINYNIRWLGRSDGHSTGNMTSLVRSGGSVSGGLFRENK
jgi:hypothetical protein